MPLLNPNQMPVRLIHSSIDSFWTDSVPCKGGLGMRPGVALSLVEWQQLVLNLNFN